MDRDALVDSVWIVESLFDEATDEPRPTVEFGSDGRLGGSTGVNRLIGSWEESADGSVSFGAAATTRMAASEAAMDQERRFLAMLVGPVELEVVGDRLTVSDFDRRQVASLARSADAQG
jgi:heat shock protein HslJ